MSHQTLAHETNQVGKEDFAEGENEKTILNDKDKTSTEEVGKEQENEEEIDSAEKVTDEKAEVMKGQDVNCENLINENEETEILTNENGEPEILTNENGEPEILTNKNGDTVTLEVEEPENNENLADFDKNQGEEEKNAETFEHENEKGEDNCDEVKEVKKESQHSMNEEPLYDRELLLQQYKEIYEERAKLKNTNKIYQNKLAEYFKKKKTDDKIQGDEKNVNDQEQRYLKYLSNLEELQTEEARQASHTEVQIEDFKEKCQEKIQKVLELSKASIEVKYLVGKSAINSRTGKAIPAKELEQFQAAEIKKGQEVIAVRLENIKLKNRLKKHEMQLKAREELAEGLHLIDFEQLKIENQTYNEKIEERNEELLKLRKKITTTVQVLTHLKEKLQFVQGEGAEQRSVLRDIEVTVAQRRDILTRMKQVRDSLRLENGKLKHKSGLLGNESLLRDFEERKDEGEVLRARLSGLKDQHTELSFTLHGVRGKLQQTSLNKID